MTLLHPGALLLAALVGFAAHRSSLCPEKAVAEVMSSGTAFTFGSFARATLWAIAVAGAAGLIWPLMPQASVTLSLPLSFAGGFVFGVGAALSGGCLLPTVQRLKPDVRKSSQLRPSPTPR